MKASGYAGGWWRGVVLAGVMLPRLTQAEAAHAEGPPPAQVQALVVRAEQTLASGDAQQAQALFEQAAARWHAAPIEAGWVRAQMQAGEYGQALAFAAHVAGAHPDEITGTLLYAWLLTVGAQQEQARRWVVDGLRRWPQDRDLQRLAVRLAGGTALPPPEGGDAGRLAPYATGDAADARAVVVGTGVLWSATVALVPAAAVHEGAPLWLRDGLGRTRRAVPRQPLPATGLWVVTLAQALAGALPPVAARDAFPGSPAFAAGYLRGDGRAQWPLLALGFLGMPMEATAGRRLGFDVPGGTGGPVVDGAGRLVGVALGPGAYLPVSALRAALDDGPAPGEAPATAAGAVASEVAYAAALRRTLQCLVVLPVAQAAFISAEPPGAWSTAPARAR